MLIRSYRCSVTNAVGQYDEMQDSRTFKSLWTRLYQRGELHCWTEDAKVCSRLFFLCSLHINKTLFTIISLYQVLVAKFALRKILQSSENHCLNGCKITCSQSLRSVYFLHKSKEVKLNRDMIGQISSFDDGIDLYNSPIDVIFLLFYCPGRERVQRLVLGHCYHNSPYSMVQGTIIGTLLVVECVCSKLQYKQRLLHEFIAPTVRQERPRFHESLDHLYFDR